MKKTLKRIIATLMTMTVLVAGNPVATIGASEVYKACDTGDVNLYVQINMNLVTIKGYSKTLFTKNRPENFMVVGNQIYVCTYFDINKNGVLDLGIFKFTKKGTSATYTGQYCIVTDTGVGATFDQFMYNSVRYFVINTDKNKSVAFVPEKYVTAKTIGSANSLMTLTGFNYAIMGSGWGRSIEANRKYIGDNGADYIVKKVTAATDDGDEGLKIQFRAEYTAPTGETVYQYSRYSLPHIMPGLETKRTASFKDAPMLKVAYETASYLSVDTIKPYNIIQGIELANDPTYIYVCANNSAPTGFRIAKIHKFAGFMAGIQINRATNPLVGKDLFAETGWQMNGIKEIGNKLYFGATKDKVYLNLYTVDASKLATV